MDKDIEEFLKGLKVYQHFMAVEALEKIKELQNLPKEDCASELRFSELDEKLARNLKFIKTKPPRCKGCWFYKNYQLDDPKRYVLVAETKINLLPFLFIDKNSRFVIPEDCFYDSYKKLFIIACPTIECGVSRDLEKSDILKAVTFDE